MPVPGGAAQGVARSSAGHCSIGGMWRRLVLLTGIAALLAWFLRWRRGPELVPSELEAADPADELRRKLDETRTLSEPEPPPAPGGDLEARRRDVHDRGRAAVDEMQQPPPD